MKKRLLPLLCLLLLNYSWTRAQSKPSDWTFQISGYLKDMQSLSFIRLHIPPNPGQGARDTTLTYFTNLLHQRLKTEISHKSGLSLRMDFRQRLFWGDGLTQPFMESLESANDYFDLSASSLNTRQRLAWHLVIDRLYLAWQNDKWDISLGRQRINWGVSTLWNPNDLFNAYSFTDFDYEERPGSDALWMRYYPSFTSSIEFAINMFDKKEGAIAALRCRFPINQWDVQLITAYDQTYWVFGGGWEGSLGNWGFKGESSYFLHTKPDDKPAFSSVLELNYITAKSHLFQAGYLFNSEGKKQTPITQLFAFELNARNLYPYQHTVFAQAQWTLSPLTGLGLALLYSPVKAQGFFFSPNFSHSLSQNLDLYFIAQLAWEKTDKFRNPVQAFFIRAKGSF